MFRFIVLTVIVATVAAKPSGIIAEVAYTAPAVAAVPATVSVVNQPGAAHVNSYRSDIVHRPPITTYSVSAPVVALQPIVRSAITAPVLRTEISNSVAHGSLGPLELPVAPLPRAVISAAPLTLPTAFASPVTRTEVAAPIISNTLPGPTVISRSALLASPAINLNSHLCHNCGLELGHTKYVLPIN